MDLGGILQYNLIGYMKDFFGVYFLFIVIILYLFQDKLKSEITRFMEKISKKHKYSVYYDTLTNENIILYKSLTCFINENVYIKNGLLNYIVTSDIADGEFQTVCSHCNYNNVEIYHNEFIITTQNHGHVKNFEYVLVSDNKKDIDQLCKKSIQNYIQKQQNIFKQLYIFSYNGNISNFPNFCKYENNSRKTFDNIVSKHVNFLKRKIDSFVNKENEYSPEKNRIYRLNILLYGPPGTGKTSFVKAIAKYTNRHIIDLNLTKNTPNMLTKTFCSSNVYINGHWNKIGLENRLYVLEELEKELEYIFKQQEKKENSDKKEKEKEKEDDKEKYKLQDFLTIFDGVIELTNTVIVATANSIENIPDTFQRRFDVILKIDYLDTEEATEYLEKYYNVKLSSPLSDIYNKNLSASYLERLVNNNNSLEKVLSIINNTEKFVE